MYTNEYVAMVLHKARLDDFDKKARTPELALKEIIAEHKAERRLNRKGNRR